MWKLVAKLLQQSISKMQASGALLKVGGATVVADITLDQLRSWAQSMAPGSDAVALEEAARTTARALGLENDEVLWPTRRDGVRIVPRYFVLDLTRGRAWMASKYYSRKSVRAAGRPRIARPRGVARYR